MMGWVQSIRDIEEQIVQQRQLVGLDCILGNLTPQKETIFLKVWWAKTELRRKYLGLLEEKRPLDAVRMGIASKLGKNLIYTCHINYNRSLTCIAPGKGRNQWQGAINQLHTQKGSCLTICG